VEIAHFGEFNIHINQNLTQFRVKITNVDKVLKNPENACFFMKKSLKAAETGKRSRTGSYITV